MYWHGRPRGIYGTWIGATPHEQVTLDRRQHATEMVRSLLHGQQPLLALIGVSLTPSGWEVSLFETPAGLEAWWNRQLADGSIAYATRFSGVTRDDQIFPTHERSR